MWFRRVTLPVQDPVFYRIFSVNVKVLTLCRTSLMSCLQVGKIERWARPISQCPFVNRACQFANGLPRLQTGQINCIPLTLPLTGLQVPVSDTRESNGQERHWSEASLGCLHYSPFYTRGSMQNPKYPFCQISGINAQTAAFTVFALKPQLWVGFWLQFILFWAVKFCHQMRAQERKISIY